MKAVLTLTNVFSIEVRDTVNSDIIEYKYSNETIWNEAEIQCFLREDEENNDDAQYVLGFKTKEDVIYYLDEFMVVERQ